jgi:PKD repeat protein
VTIIPLEGNVPPVASFGWSPGTQVIGEPVEFDASDSSDPDGTIQTYFWDFGDGSTGSGVSASHSYASAGTYGITLTVTDNESATDTAIDEILIASSHDEVDNTPPVANAGKDMTVKSGSKLFFSAAGSSDNVGIISYVWDFGDGTTGTGETPSHTYDTAGTYTVSLTVEDAAKNSNKVTIIITVEEEAAGFPFWILIPIILAVVAVVLLWFFLKKRKPKEKLPKPTKLRITTDLNEILADGKSTSKITVELLDKDGNPVAALADTEIKITVTGGKLEKPVVKIPRGKESEKTLLRASKESGTVSLSADAEGLERAIVTVIFKEKKRYCMHCGAKMTFAAKRCPECDKTPPAGVDTKLCKNCNAVIPVVAKFCAECGANQPKE